MHARVTFLAATVLCAFAGGSGHAAEQPAPTPRQMLDQAITAQGGEEALTSILALAIDSMGHQWAIEQSERPEGPWLTVYQQRAETRDVAGGRRQTRTQRRDWNFPEWSPELTLVVSEDVAARQSNGRWFPGSPADVRDWKVAQSLEPERLLLTARAAPDLHRDADEVQQGVTQRILRFTAGGRPCRLLLNAWTMLPTMLEFVRDDPMWGDVREQRWFSFWTMHDRGLMYPRQTTTTWNGTPYSDWTVQRLTVNPEVDPQVFAIPDDARQSFEAQAGRPTGMNSLTLDDTRAIDLADWVTQVPGGFNVGIVRQPDGLVILESTTTPAYSASVLAFAGRRFPGAPIKAVVTTSDAWPHISGIREYVARGIPIHALDLNVPILTRMIEAPHTLAPDRLARAPRAPRFRPVTGRTTIGAGDTRIELIPVRGETGERMMLVWLPGARLLYSSDLIQPGRPGTRAFFMPMMLAEVQAAVERERIAGIDRVFGMHLPPTPWTDVLEAIAAAKR